MLHPRKSPETLGRGKKKKNGSWREERKGSAIGEMPRTLIMEENEGSDDCVDPKNRREMKQLYVPMRNSSLKRPPLKPQSSTISVQDQGRRSERPVHRTISRLQTEYREETENYSSIQAKEAHEPPHMQKEGS